MDVTNFNREELTIYNHIKAGKLTKLGLNFSNDTIYYKFKEQVYKIDDISWVINYLSHIKKLIREKNGLKR